MRAWPTSSQEERESLFRLIQDAREEWQLANNHFSWVTDPKLVDYTIYWSLAAQSRYRYLLALAKSGGAKLSVGEVLSYSLLRGAEKVLLQEAVLRTCSLPYRRGRLLDN